MAKVIEFYIPTNFQKSATWTPQQRRRKVIEFCSQTKKSARLGGDRRGGMVPGGTSTQIVEGAGRW